jgi:hypothetical protein
VFQKHKEKKLALEHRRQVTDELRTRAARLPEADGGISLESFQDFFR